MFTGIITAIGQIVRVDPLEPGSDEAGLRLKIHAAGMDLASVRLGDSIAVQGACMTVVSLDGNAFEVDVSRESLSVTAGLDRPGEVNLERPMKLGDTLDGHLVSGHVDGIGAVTVFREVGESHELRVLAPPDLAKYLAYKGSITVDGVSLTINEVKDVPQGCEIRINLIPHTLRVTTLKHLAPGARVNLEVDMIARYVERMHSLIVQG